MVTLVTNWLHSQSILFIIFIYACNHVTIVTGMRACEAFKKIYIEFAYARLQTFFRDFPKILH